jgi:hypothetical protein
LNQYESEVLDQKQATRLIATQNIATSLKPSALLGDFLAGDPEATEIIEAWKFHEPVVVMPREELEALAESRYTVFAGNLTDPRTNSIRFDGEGLVIA